MYTMPLTTGTMPRKKQTTTSQVNFQFRLSAEESQVWNELWVKTKHREPFIDKTQFNRALVGLAVKEWPQDKKLVSDADRMRFYAAGADNGDGNIELVGIAPAARPRIRQVPTEEKKKNVR